MSKCIAESIGIFWHFGHHDNLRMRSKCTAISSDGFCCTFAKYHGTCLHPRMCCMSIYVSHPAPHKTLLHICWSTIGIVSALSSVPSLLFILSTSERLGGISYCIPETTLTDYNWTDLGVKKIRRCDPNPGVFISGNDYKTQQGGFYMLKWQVNKLNSAALTPMGHKTFRFLDPLQLKKT